MPRTIERLWHRLRALLLRRRVDTALSAEIALHLDEATREYVARGLSPEDARLAARRDFGGVALVEEQCRDTRRVAIAQSLIQDLRYGLRALVAQPLVVLAATASIGAGAGATAFVVNLASELLFARPSARDVDSLVNIRLDGSSHVSYADWRALDETGVLDGLAGYHIEGSVNIRQGDRTDAVVPMLVTANFFDVARRAGGPRPRLHRGRSGRRARSAGGRRQRRLLARPPRRGSGRGRPRADRQRRAVHDPRRPAEGTQGHARLRPRARGLPAVEPHAAARPRPSARRRRPARRPPEARRRHRSGRRGARHRGAAAASRGSRSPTAPRRDDAGHQRAARSRQPLELLRRAGRGRRAGARHRLRQRRRPPPGAQHRAPEGAGAAGGARRLAGAGRAAALRRVDLAGRARHRHRRAVHGGRDGGGRQRAAAAAAAAGAGRAARLAALRPHAVDGRDRDPGERRAAGADRLARRAVTGAQAGGARLRPPALDAARPARDRPGDAVGRPRGDGAALRPQPVAGADVEPRLRHGPDGRRAAGAGREPLHAGDARRLPAAGRRARRGAARRRARGVRLRHAAQHQARTDVRRAPHDRRRAGQVGVLGVVGREHRRSRILRHPRHRAPAGSRLHRGGHRRHAAGGDRRTRRSSADTSADARRSACT